MRRALYRVYLPIAVLLLASLACSLTQQTLDAPQETGDGATGQLLDCEVEGYPCSYAETPPGVLDASFAILKRAALTLQETGSI